MIFHLDKNVRQKYTVHLIFLVLISLFSPMAISEAAEPNGVLLPPGSYKVGRNRYRSPRNWTETLTFFDKEYKDYPRTTIVNRPDLRAIHIANRSSRGKWEGINIYDLEGETRIFVVSKEISKTPSGGGKSSKNR